MIELKESFGLFVICIPKSYSISESLTKILQKKQLLFPRIFYRRTQHTPSTPCDGWISNEKPIPVNLALKVASSVRTVILQDAYQCCLGSFSQTVNNSVLAVSEGLPGLWALLMGLLNILYLPPPAALTEVLEERRE